MTAGGTSADFPVLAAGTVPRRTQGAQVEVLLVHRPKYDDWSFPKGKLDPGEHGTAAAVRETQEESGLVVGLDAPLPVQHYVASGRPKRVDYWAATVLGGRFSPNSEVDRVAWLPLADARARLTWQRDAVLVDALEEQPGPTTPLLLVAPGSSLPRESAPSTSPLDALGHAQARALLPLVTAYAPARLVCSDEVGALESATPLADATGLVVEVNPLLGSHAWAGAAPVVREQLRTHVAEPVRTVLYGSAAPALLSFLARQEAPADTCDGGASLLVLHQTRGHVVALEHHTVDRVEPS